MGKDKLKNDDSYEAGPSPASPQLRVDDGRHLLNAFDRELFRNVDHKKPLVDKIQDPWCLNTEQDLDQYKVQEENFETKLELELGRLEKNITIIESSKDSEKKSLRKNYLSSDRFVQKDVLVQGSFFRKDKLSTKSVLQLFAVILCFEVFRMFYVVFMAL